MAQMTREGSNGDGTATAEWNGGALLAQPSAEVIDITDRRSWDRTVAGGPPVTTSVIIPTLNEAENIVHVLPKVPEWVTEVILVDGLSSDDTVEVARSVRPDLIVVLDTTPGKGAALRAGFAAATSDIVITIDADGSTDPAEIPAFIGLLLAGADLVKGSRFVQGGGTDDMGILRRSGNWGLTRLVRTLYGGKYTDLCYGYCAFWRRNLPLLDGDVDGFEIETFVNISALKHGLKVVEVPSFEADRISGQSNLRTFADGWRVLKTIIRQRFTRTTPDLDLVQA